MSDVQKFYSDDARGVLCVRAERYDALAAELAVMTKHTDNYSRMFERAAEELDECAAVLPGVAYMDQPDGGAPSIPEQLRRMRADLDITAAELAALKAGAGEPVGHFNGEFGGGVDKRLWFRVVAAGALPAAGAYLYTRPPIAPDSCNPSTCENAQVGMLCKAPEVEAVEVVAYCAFADNGNIRMWGRSTESVCELIDSAGNKAVPLMTLAQHNRIIAQLTGTN